jgi:aryl-alcohol dehydrogenase-like predicted oxidoreductase
MFPRTRSAAGDAATLEWHRRRATPLLAWSTQANGFFATAPLDAAPAGRHHPDVPWAGAGWVLVRILSPTADKHHGRLEPGDTVRVPSSLAGFWVQSGIARPEEG